MCIEKPVLDLILSQLAFQELFWNQLKYPLTLSATSINAHNAWAMAFLKPRQVQEPSGANHRQGDH